jgi:hypothetical protein
MGATNQGKGEIMTRELDHASVTFLGFAGRFAPTLLLLAALLFAGGYWVGRQGTGRYVPAVAGTGTVQSLLSFDTRTGEISQPIRR